jgi:hypothetical protein
MSGDAAIHELMAGNEGSTLIAKAVKENGVKVAATVFSYLGGLLDLDVA